MRKSSFAGMISFVFVFSFSVVFKGIKNKFPKAAYNRFICCVKKDILSYLCHSTSGYLLLSLFCEVFGKNCYESLHLRLIARISSSIQASLILQYVFSWGTKPQISLKRGCYRSLKTLKN